MKIHRLLFLILLGFSSTPAFSQSEGPTGAYGVTFVQPPGWTMTTETDPAWTKFRLSKPGGLPKVMIQIYSGKVSPVSVLNAYVTAHRTKYRDNGWQYTQTPTHETFGKRYYNGRQIIYTNNNYTYCQRFFGLDLNGHTVLVMSLSHVQEGWNWNYWGYNSYTPDDLGPIASSLMGEKDAQPTAE